MTKVHKIFKNSKGTFQWYHTFVEIQKDIFYKYYIRGICGNHDNLQKA